MALQVLELPASLAESAGSELQIVHCWGSWMVGDSARWLQKIPPSQRRDLSAVAKESAKQRLDELLGNLLSIRRHGGHLREHGHEGGYDAVEQIRSLGTAADPLKSHDTLSYDEHFRVDSSGDRSRGPTLAVIRALE